MGQRISRRRKSGPRRTDRLPQLQITDDEARAKTS